ncbi:type II toxin-antitoxin system HicA family toxin [Caenispirillum salinarum]|uniref:type II toxin-antitoxin system HicA family toxin n=1 Tax=Caenispirillum salinarum TaxID=859058 RepID=UPI00384CEBE2
MTQRDKLLKRMASSPQSDWTIQDVERVCDGWGLTMRRTGGSHVTLTHPSQPDVVTIPAHRPIRPVYIRMLVDFVSRVARSTIDDE